MTKKQTATAIIFTVSIFTFLLDRGLKLFIDKILMQGESIFLENNLFSFTKVYNTGAAFGILQHQTIFLAIFSLLVILSIGFYALKNNQKLNTLQATSIGMIIGGTAGNMYDRLILGYVIDFIKPELINFPVFNIADMCINIGVFLILVQIIFQKENQPE